MKLYNQRTITHWYGSIMHVHMAELFHTSHTLIYLDGRSIRRQCPFLQQTVWDDAIKVCIQLYNSSIYSIYWYNLVLFLHILFNYICQNRGILFAIPENSFASTLRAVAKLQFARTRVITLLAHSVVVYTHQLYVYLWDTVIVILFIRACRHRVYCEQCQTMQLIYDDILISNYAKCINDNK